MIKIQRNILLNIVQVIFTNQQNLFTNRSWVILKLEEIHFIKFLLSSINYMLEMLEEILWRNLQTS